MSLFFRTCAHACSRCRAIAVTQDASCADGRSVVHINPFSDWLAQLFMLLVLTGLWFSVANPAHAQTSLSPEVTRGVAWLKGQVNADGSLGNETASIATALQNRAETAQTLGLLANLPAPLAAAVASNNDTHTEYLARKVLALLGSSVDTSAIINTLLQRQNTDGGFGPNLAWASEPLDTAWALLALASVKQSNPPGVDLALNYLLQSRQPDGGWGVDDQSRVWISAMVLLASNQWKSQFDVSSLSGLARDYLVAKANNGVYDNVSNNAIVLLALVTQSSTGWQALQDALKAAQQGDGSWGQDPFATALALRALGSAGNPASNTTSGDVTGSVVDAASNAALADATVQIVELPTFATSSSATGTFALRGVAAGRYTLSVSKLGYAPRQIAIAVTGGQALTLSPVALSASALSATLVGVTKDQNGNPLGGVLVAVGTVSTLSDNAGVYQLTGINAGTAGITAVKSNYQTVSTTASFVAGGTYTFSPSLYPNSIPQPATISLKGKVVDANGNAPLAGVSVKLGATLAKTAADGSFSFANLTVGAFALSLNFNGYQSVTLNGSLGNGANDLGNVPLARQSASNTLKGVVKDSSTGTPLAGALVALGGTGLSATADANGVYQITGISGLNLIVQASASGYLSSNMNVTLSQTGTSVLDVKLLKTQASGISFDSIKPTKTAYAPSDKLEINAVVKNATAGPVSLVVDAELRDGQGTLVRLLKANAHGPGENPPNLPLVFNTGLSEALELETFLIRQAAGDYSVKVRAYDGNGVVVAEGSTQLTVLSQASLLGGVVLDPPLAQAGISTPVKINAQLQNGGNLPILPGNASLVVTLDHADPANASAAQIKALTLSSDNLLHDPRGLVLDASGNRYTVNYVSNQVNVIRIDPQGGQTVYAHITDPSTFHLAGLAIDAQGKLWVGNEGPPKIMQVGNQGVIDSRTISSLDKISALDVDANGNLLVTGQGGNEDRLIKRTPQGSESILWRNGLYNPIGIIKDAQGNWVVSSNGDGTLLKVSPDGLITPFATGLNRPMGLALDSSGNIMVANNGDGSIVKVAPDGSKSVYATGLIAPTDIKFDAGGTLYVSVESDNSLYRVPPGGQAELFTRGIANGPQGMKYDATGRLFIANDDGSVRVKEVNDQVNIIATALSKPRGLDVAANGDVYVANSGDGTISKISGTTKTTFASGLGSPYGVALDGAGNVFVTEQSPARITQFDNTGKIVNQTESAVYYASNVRIGADGRVYIQNSNSISVIENGNPRIFARVSSLKNFTVDPVNGGLVALGNDNATVYRISTAGVVSTFTRITANATTTLAVDGGGNILYVDYYAKKLMKIDANGHASVVSSITDAIDGIISDLAGNIFVWRSNPGLVLKVDANGNTSPFYSTGSYLFTMGMGQDGRPLAVTNAGFNVLDKVTGAPIPVPISVNALNGVALDGNNRILTISGAGATMFMYDFAGKVIGELDGFFSPKDIVWTGSELRFAEANSLYKMTPGSYPQYINNGGNFANGYLSRVGNDFYSVAYTGLYKWSETGVSIVTYVDGVQLSSIAAKPGGGFAIGSNGTNLIINMDAGYRVTSQFPGLYKPQGLAFDAQGRLYVASFTPEGLIIRFDAGSRTASLFARTYYPHHMSFDPAGNLWVGTTAGAQRITPDGIATKIPGSYEFHGIFADASGVVGVEKPNGQLRRFVNNQWPVWATGLVNPLAVRAMPDGTINVANGGNGTLVKWNNGKLNLIAGDLGEPHAFYPTPDGKIVVAGKGAIAQVGVDGSVTNLDAATLLSAKVMTGVVQQADGSLLTIANESNTVALLQLTVTPAQAAPAAGTEVYRTTRAVNGLVPGAVPLDLDFGNWIPPYSGDFKVEVTYPNGVGSIQNYLHVGPLAKGVLSSSVNQVGPGTQKVPLTLGLSGADFTSISRVEVAQVRRLLSVPQPKGMTSDRAGNLWFTTGNSLNKTTPDGITTTIVSGLTPVFGLAIDSQQRLYFIDNTSDFHLIQVTQDGTKTDLGLVGTYVNGNNGVVVNSLDEVFIGSTGKLLKYSPTTRQLTQVSSVGIERPKGLAIDGRDNVYVQNEAGVVSRIAPDGTATILYSKNDGVVEPSFEGDGQPTIAADCADNFYIAPSQWARVGIEAQEESSLAQVVPRTGQAVSLFNGQQIDAKLSDIDYLAFDRFNNRVLMWNDHGSPPDIWQVPVTCGATSVDAHLLTKPGQTLTGFDRAPNAIIPLADGRTEYVWSIANVTVQTLGIHFDTLLNGLALGETRPTLDSAFLQFKNSFSPTDVKVPMLVPVVSVGNVINLNLVSDKPEYSASQNAQLTTTLGNPNSGAITGELLVKVVDSNNALVATVSQQNVRIDANASSAVTGLFAIGSIASGDYKVFATLSSNGSLQAASNTSFKVLADAAQATVVSSLTLDKQSYAPADTVNINSRVVNQSANASLSGLLLNLKLQDPNGKVLLTKLNSVTQLTPGLTASFAASYALANAAPGTYGVTQTLTDAQARTWDSHTVNFTVAASSDTGSGLSGTLAVTPKTINAGDSLTLAFSASNNGNSAQSNLPLTVRILNPATQAVLIEFPYTATLAIGASFSQSVSWGATSGAAPNNTPTQYVAVLLAKVGSSTLTLAQDIFKVNPVVVPQTALDISQQAANWQNVLVLSRCKRAADDLIGQCGAVALPVEDAVALAKCDLDRATALDKYLTGAGVAHKVTSSSTDFLQSVRSGLYNTYWVSNGATSLRELPVDELRAAVVRGGGLLVEGLSSGRNVQLTQCAGVNFTAKYATADQPLSVLGTLFTPGDYRITALPVQLKAATGSVVEARLGPVVSSTDGIISATLGTGKALTFGFDWSDTLRVASTSTDSARWLDITQKSLAYLTPGSGASGSANTWLSGEIFTLSTRIRNTGQAATVQVLQTLPAGAQIINTSPQANPATSSSASWTLVLPAGADVTLTLRLRVPVIRPLPTDGGNTSISVSIAIVVSLVNGGVPTPYKNLSYDFVVRSSHDLLAQLVANITALSLSGTTQLDARTVILAELTRVGQALNKNQPDQALRRLLLVQTRLKRIDADGTQALALARLLATVEALGNK